MDFQFTVGTKISQAYPELYYYRSNIKAQISLFSKRPNIKAQISLFSFGL
jgi:hypothetical protein